MSTQLMWFASRGSGLALLLLFTAVMVAGALNSGRLGTTRWPRFAVAAVHRNLSLLALAFLAVHVATAVIDTYAGIGWLDAVLPFGSVYRPVWLGLGALAGDLLIAIVLTSLLRVRIGLRTWKVLHYASYACWPLAVIHGLGTANYDARISWVLVVNAVCVLTVLIAVGWRTSRRHADTLARRAGSAAR